MFSVVGGKLTTYRSLAEQVVDQLCRYARLDLLGCETASRPLPGGAGDRMLVQTELARGGSLSADTIARLVRIYGTRAEDVARLVRAKPALGARLGGNTHALAAEIVFGYQAEMAATLADCLFRRCMVGLESGFDSTVIDNAVATAREHFGWSEARAQDERQGILREANALGIIIGAGP
jgi:glycerol-3-phosphate dehydrogenase